MVIRVISIIAASTFFISSAHAKETKQPPVSVETLRAIQTRIYIYPPEKIISIILNVLADQGYVIDSVDRSAGLINANKVGSSRQSMAGLNVRQNTDLLNIIVSAEGEMSSSVRINIIDRYQYNYLGKPYKDEKTQITMPEKYDAIFNAIDQKIKSK